MSEFKGTLRPYMNILLLFLQFLVGIISWTLLISSYIRSITWPDAWEVKWVWPWLTWSRIISVLCATIITIILLTNSFTFQKMFFSTFLSNFKCPCSADTSGSSLNKLIIIHNGNYHKWFKLVSSTTWKHIKVLGGNLIQIREHYLLPSHFILSYQPLKRPFFKNFSTEHILKKKKRCCISGTIPPTKLKLNTHSI